MDTQEEAFLDALTGAVVDFIDTLLINRGQRAISTDERNIGQGELKRLASHGKYGS